MAGHRRADGKPKRCDNRRATWDRAVTTAPTGKRQVATAFDRWRAAVSRHPEAEQLLWEQATRLNAEAIQLEGAAA